MKTFLKELLSSGDNVSSKRVLAMLSFIVAVILAFTRSIDTVYSFLGFAAALLGFGTLDKFIYSK